MIHAPFQPTAPRSAITLTAIFLASIMGLCTTPAAFAQDEEYEPIDSSMCADCHEAGAPGSAFADEISHSVHDGVECLDCHQDRGTVPHRGLDANSTSAARAAAPATKTPPNSTRLTAAPDSVSARTCRTVRTATASTTFFPHR